MLSLPGLDAPKLLTALALVESDGGRNNYPRLEVAYMPRGERFTVQGRLLVGTGACWNALVAGRWTWYGLASAASYSPWQILYHTATDRGYGGAPWRLWNSVEAQPWVELHLRWLYDRGAKTVAQLADAWNSGTHRDSIVPTAYIEKVVAAYAGQGKGALQ